MTNYLYISTVFISIVLALFFSFHNWTKSPFKKLISLQLWVISYGLFVNYLSIKGFFIEWPHFSRTALICIFLAPSILFLSIYRELYKKSYRWYDILHFIPVTIYILNYSPYYILSAEEKIKILSNPNVERFNEGILPSYFLLILTIVQISMYIIWLYSIYRELKEKTKNHPILTLIKYYMGYMSLQFLLIMVTIHYYFGTYHLNEIFTIIYAIGNIFFSFKVLSTPVWIFEPLEIKNDISTEIPIINIEIGNIEEQVANKIKAKSDNINSEEDLLLLNKFLSSIKDPKVFLDPDFSQKNIAKELSVSEYKVRQVLDKAFEIKFSELSNLLKINYFFNELKNNKSWQKYTIDSIANKLGYKSSNSFYMNFKKITGLTPKDYLDLR